MSSIVITPKNAAELHFLTELLQKLGIESVILSQEEKEDIGLTTLMKEVDRTKKVSRESVMRKLTKKNARRVS